MRPTVSPLHHQRQPITRLTIALPAAALVTGLVLLAMIALLEQDRRADPTVAGSYPLLSLRLDRPQAVSSRRPPPAPPSSATPPPRRAPFMARWDPLTPNPGLARPRAPRREDPAPADLAAQIQAPWSRGSVVDWRRQASAVAAEGLQREVPAYFSEGTSPATAGPTIDFSVRPIAPRRGLPESYRNGYGEAVIQVNEDCVARENRSMDDADYIDFLPPIVSCTPPESTFNLPAHIADRARRLPLDGEGPIERDAPAP